MDQLVARAEIVERLRNCEMLGSFLTAHDVRQLVDWIESDVFLATCIAADADPMAVRNQFNTIVNRAFNDTLMAL